MFIGKKDGTSLGEDLGLSKDRIMELAEVVNSILQKFSDDDDPRITSGRTSHVLLEIDSRRDLSDIEKMVCTLMFICHVYEDDVEDIGYDAKERENSMYDVVEHQFRGDAQEQLDMHITERNNIVECSINDDRGINQEKVAGILMDIMALLLKSVPDSQKRKFCKAACVRFFTMAKMEKA